MRSASYVTISLLITSSVRTSAEADRSGNRHLSHHDGLAPSSVITNSSPRGYLRSFRKQHDAFSLSAADEERMPVASSKSVENAFTSSSEEALIAIRKAAHLTFDLNAPPEEPVTGALEAYNIVRHEDPRTFTASNPGVPSSHLGNKRAAKAPTSQEKASSSANPKKTVGRQPKKPRTGAPSKVTKAQSSISRGEVMPAPRTLSKDDVQNVHDLYLEHLKRNSARFRPTKDETREMLDLINGTGNLVPSLAKTYAQYVEELMKMDSEKLKELSLNSETALKPNLRELLEQPSENFKDIQFFLLRLLRLKRWMRMYRDFFNFCLVNSEVCSNFSAMSTLQIELQVQKKLAKSSVETALTSAVSGTEESVLTRAERTMLKEVVDAVNRANLEETDKQTIYETVGEVYRGDDQLTAPDLFALIAGASSSKASTYYMLRTPSRPDGIKKLHLGGPDEWSRDRTSITKLLKEMTLPVEKTTGQSAESIVNEDEVAKITAIHKAFIEDSQIRYEVTFEMIRKMWKISNWKRGTSDPKLSTLPGHYLSRYVRRLNKTELETALGSKWVEDVKKNQQVSEDNENYLLELETQYLLVLLETYDKFLPFCVKNRSLCGPLVIEKST